MWTASLMATTAVPTSSVIIIISGITCIFTLPTPAIGPPSFTCEHSESNFPEVPSTRRDDLLLQVHIARPRACVAASSARMLFNDWRTVHISGAALVQINSLSPLIIGIILLTTLIIRPKQLDRPAAYP